jgi:hypothetical protein
VSPPPVAQRREQGGRQHHGLGVGGTLDLVTQHRHHMPPLGEGRLDGMAHAVVGRGALAGMHQAIQDQRHLALDFDYRRITVGVGHGGSPFVVVM